MQCRFIYLCFQISCQNFQDIFLSFKRQITQLSGRELYHASKSPNCNIRPKSWAATPDLRWKGVCCYFSPIRSFLPYQGGSKAPRLKTWIKHGCLRSRGFGPLIRLLYSIFNCHGWQWLQWLSLIRITILSLLALFFCKLYIALHQDNPNRQSLLVLFKSLGSNNMDAGAIITRPQPARRYPCPVVTIWGGLCTWLTRRPRPCG